MSHVRAKNIFDHLMDKIHFVTFKGKNIFGSLKGKIDFVCTWKEQKYKYVFGHLWDNLIASFANW